MSCAIQITHIQMSLLFGVWFPFYFTVNVIYSFNYLPFFWAILFRLQWSDWALFNFLVVEVEQILQQSVPYIYTSTQIYHKVKLIMIILQDNSCKTMWHLKQKTVFKNCYWRIDTFWWEIISQIHLQVLVSAQRRQSGAPEGQYSNWGGGHIHIFVFCLISYSACP